MFDVVDIIRAYAAKRKPTPEEEELATRRLAICEPCEERKYNELFKLWKCGACGCALSGKVFSKKRNSIACPKNKWAILDEPAPSTD